MDYTQSKIELRRDMINARMEKKKASRLRIKVDGDIETNVISLNDIDYENKDLCVDVIIPFYGCIEERRENLRITINRIIKICENCNITVVEQGVCSKEFISQFPVNYLSVDVGSKLFHKSEILNKAVNNSSSDIIVMLDADMIIHKDIIKNFALYAKRGVLTMPFYDICYTTKEQKTLVIKDNEYLFGEHCEIMEIPLMRAVGGCNIFFRQDYETINGWNECFVGWGGEDTEFAIKFTKSLNGIRHLNVMGIHLWHKTENALVINQPPLYYKHNLSILNNTKTQIARHDIPIWYPMYVSKNKKEYEWELFMLHSLLNAASLNKITLNMYIVTNKPDDVHNVITHYNHDVSIITEFPTIDECYDKYNIAFLNQIDYDVMLTHYLKVLLPSIILNKHKLFAHIDNDILFMNKNPIDWVSDTPNFMEWSSDLSHGLGPNNLGTKWLSSGQSVLPNLTDEINTIYKNIYPILKNKTLVNNHNNGSNYGDELAYVYAMHNVFRSELILNKPPIKVDSRIICLSGTDNINFDLHKYSGIHFGGFSKTTGKRSCEITNKIWNIIDEYNNTKIFKFDWFNTILTI